MCQQHLYKQSRECQPKSVRGAYYSMYHLFKDIEKNGKVQLFIYSVISKQTLKHFQKVTWIS
jgi:hypothetical protein